jgi:hypothetical protein
MFKAGQAGERSQRRWCPLKKTDQLDRPPLPAAVISVGNGLTPIVNTLRVCERGPRIFVIAAKSIGDKPPKGS